MGRIVQCGDHKTQESSAFAKRASLVNCVNIAAAFAAFLASGAGNGYLLFVQMFFALFWGLSVFSKVPITCYFSAAGYGGEKMLENPLFTRTNRILMACWAVEYLLLAGASIALHLQNAPGWYAALTYVSVPLIGVLTGVCKVVSGAPRKKLPCTQTGKRD